MEETIMNTTNDVVEEVAETTDFKAGKTVAIALVVVAGITLAGFAVKKIIAKVKAKKAEAEYQECDMAPDDQD